MRYLGGKTRIARRIVDAITEHAFQRGTPTRVTDNVFFIHPTGGGQ